jgi:hypothetical protein
MDLLRRDGGGSVNRLTLTRHRVLIVPEFHVRHFSRDHFALRIAQAATVLVRTPLHRDQTLVRLFEDGEPLLEGGRPARAGTPCDLRSPPRSGKP